MLVRGIFYLVDVGKTTLNVGGTILRAGWILHGGSV